MKEDDKLKDISINQAKRMIDFLEKNKGDMTGACLTAKTDKELFTCMVGDSATVVGLLETAKYSMLYACLSQNLADLSAIDHNPRAKGY